MAEKIQDAEDRLLDEMFQADGTEITDDGFSDRVVRRIRRQMWVRRLALPIAMIVGAAIALKPATQLFGVGAQVLDSLAINSVLPQTAIATQLPLFVMAGMALAFIMVTFRISEE
ncbi:MAG: DUF5056 domain-containing protein [Woeseiaceae bacterium]